MKIMRYVYATWLLTFVLAAGGSFAATYYVDFADGVDSRAGTSAEQGWKHCPGDAAATGTALSKTLQPGDTVIFKGGVEYPGELKLKSSGAVGHPITFDGNTAGTFGAGAAIFSGAQHVTNWVRCTSQTDAGGAPDWQNCFSVDIPDVGIVEPWVANFLYDNRTRGVVARKPNATTDPLWWDDLTEYQLVTEAEITTNTVLVPEDFAVPGESWAGGYAGTWARDNRIQFREIAATSGDGRTLTLNGSGAPRPGKNYFALFNHPRILDVRGEFALVNNNRRIIFYAGSNGAAPSSATISARRYGIDLNFKSHYVFQGLTFTCFSGSFTDKQAGSGILSGSGGATPTDILIQNCLFNYNLAIVSRNGAIYIVSADHVTIDDCRFEENQGARGITVSGCNHVVISNNDMDRNGGTGILNIETKNSLITGNRIIRHAGMHANGISVYQGSTNVIVANNIVTEGNTALTIQSSRDIIVSYNVFTTQNADGYVFSIWPKLKAPGYSTSENITIRNNVILSEGKAGKAGNLLNNDDGAKGTFRIYNNIVGGTGIAVTDAMEMRNNLYTAFSAAQAKAGWVFEPGAIKATRGERIFVNSAKKDYHLASGSPAIDAGTDWGQTNDISGNLMSGAAPDIGAYEYKSSDAIR